MRKNGKKESLAPTRVKRGRARLVGYGLDNQDGHVRYTTAHGVELYGGSHNAHAEMQRRALIIQEKLDTLGISLEHMTYEQYLQAKEIVDSVNAE